MYWANFLHIYQPPTQKKHWVEKITQESYRPIVKGLKENPNAKATININGILCEFLAAYGGIDVLDDLRLLLKRGQVELTASAKYHPLLPKLPANEIKRQIALNAETSKKYFGDLYQPKGFFPPEMGFSIEVAKIIKDLGYQWIIVDELSFGRTLDQMKHDTVYTIDGLGDFAIFFRERRMSYKILSGQLGSGELLVESLGDRLKKNEYMLTAMDGETFGHHRPGMEHLLFEIYKSKRLETVTISDVLSLFPKRETIAPLPSTWALMEKDLEKNEPFSRWDDSTNPIHAMQWQLTNLAIQSTARVKESAAEYEKLRAMLDRSLHSDQYWWASAKPWWSLEMIEAGAKELKDTIQANSKTTKKEKERAQQLYQDILFLGFEWQRNGTVEELSRQEDEEVRQRSDQGMPKLPRKEINKIIAHLREEMKNVAGNEEYERAAQLRNRIKELESYADEAGA